MSRKNKTKEPILPKVKILADFFNHGLKLTRHEVAHILNVNYNVVNTYIHLVNRFEITITSEPIPHTNRCLYFKKGNLNAK